LLSASFFSFFFFNLPVLYFTFMRPRYPSTTLTKSVAMLAVADVLIDAASVLGGDATLRILYVKLAEVCFVF